MKQFLYLLTFAASVGTVGVVATNPQLVQQGASFLGVSSPGSSAVSEPDDDHLARFLSQYPYANKEDAASKRTEMPPADSPESKPSIASKAPALPPVPPAPPLPPPSAPKTPDPEPLKESTKEVAKKPDPPKAPAPEPVKEAPEEVAKKPDPPKAPAPEPKSEPKEEVAKQPDSAKEDKSKAPSLPIIAPVVISKKEVAKAPVAETVAAKPAASPAPTPAAPEPVAKEPIATPPAKEPIAAAKPADPFSTAQTSPVPSFDGPAQESIGVAMTPKPGQGVPPPQSPSVYESGNLEKPVTPAKSEPAPIVAAPPTQPAPPAQPTPPVPPIAAAPIAPEKPMTPPAMAPATDPFLANQTNEPPIVPSFGNPYGQPGSRPEPGGFAQAPPIPPAMPQSMPPAAPPTATSVPPQTGMMASQPTGNPALAPPQGVPPQAQPQPAQPKASSQFQVSPSIVAEEVPCHGSEIVARVGREVILMCDILPQLRRAGMRVINDQLKKMPPEERAQVPKQELEHAIDQIVESQYPNFLQEQIQVALVYNDFYVAKNKEERETFEKKFGEEFDNKEIPEMIKEFGVRDMAELKQFLNDQLGSSIDKERRLWVRTLIAQQWIHFSTQGATGECTHDEMMEYYTENRERFTSKAKVQWQEMFVAFSNHKTEQDAHMKIAWMGNQVAAGFPLEDIAKKNSDGFTASKGGLWDWTFRGSLASEELENAIFTQPIGVLSPKIIRSEKGFHLVRAVKREESRTTPFIDAQVIIRERIRQQRRQKFEHEYFDELNRRYPTIVLKEKIDFDLNRRTATVFGGAR